jgi:hypothetical protein
VAEDFQVSEELVPHFFLQKEGELVYAVINGMLLDLSKENYEIANSLILHNK